MRKLRYLLPALLLVAVLFAAFAPATPVAQASESCTTQTVSYEVVKSWVLDYIHAEVTTASDVVLVQVFNYTILEIEGDRHVVDFDFEYVHAEGEHVIAHGSFVLTNDCTPDFGSGDNMQCSTLTANEVYEIIIAEGSFGGVVLSYDEWYTWSLETKFLDIGVHYEQWQLDAWYFQYLITLNLNIETITKTCWHVWQPGPVTLHLEGNGSLREPFTVVAYIVNPEDHPALDAGLRSDPFGTVRNSAYLGEQFLFDGTVDVLGGGDVYVVLSQWSDAVDQNVLVVLLGVEDEPVFAGYWSVFDADNNGEAEAAIITMTDSFFTGWNYTHQPAN